MMAGRHNKGEPMMDHDPLAELDGDEEPQAQAGPAGQVENGEVQARDRVDLGESLTIPDVGEVHERLRAALDLGELRIAGGELEQVDAAGIQLLCSAVKSARAQSCDLAWDGVSQRLREAARQLGLEAELALDG